MFIIALIEFGGGLPKETVDLDCKVAIPEMIFSQYSASIWAALRSMGGHGRHRLQLAILSAYNIPSVIRLSMLF